MWSLSAVAEDGFDAFQLTNISRTTILNPLKHSILCYCKRLFNILIHLIAYKEVNAFQKFIGELAQINVVFHLLRSIIELNTGFPEAIQLVIVLRIVV